MAGAIGVILIVAALVTAYAHAVRTDIPKYGAENEHLWDETLAGSLRTLSHSLGEGLTRGSPLAMTLPSQPSPRALEMPMVGRTEPLPATGLLTFTPQCTSMNATHTLANSMIIPDLTNGSRGCLRFAASPVYSNPFGYRVEFGGILRVQGDRAVVLAGPSMELDSASPVEYRASIGIPGLRGPSSSASLDTTSVRIDLVPGASAGELEQAPNAGSATWTFDTAYAQAWKTWFEGRFAQAGFVAHRANPAAGESSADYTLSCMPVDCGRNADGMGRLIVTINGPRTDTDDLKLSVTYGMFDVNLY